MSTLSPPTSVPEALARAAERAPASGITVLDGRGREACRIAWPELTRRLQAGAGRLAARGVRPGDVVVVALPTSDAFLDAWLGALLLGALPVAMAPTGSMGAAEFHLRKVEGVAARLGARRIVASATLREDARALGLETIGERAITAEELAATSPAPTPPREVDPDAPAFLQLTSGSTGLPRAVPVTHRALFANTAASDDAIGRPFGVRAEEHFGRMVSWLPLNHDMGLVGCLFQSLYSGLDLTLLQPKSFLARPRLWLERFAGGPLAFAPAPNFAYQLCVERIEPDEAARLDLSGWRAAMCGAEMIRTETVRAFCELFEPAGFRPESFRPCYGLAEGTLTVTFDTKGEGVRSIAPPEGTDRGFGLTDVVCVGEPVADTEVRITAPDGTALPEGRVGEVRAAGPGIFGGYWNEPEGENGVDDGWLVTGDLGFLHRGELYLTGRTKDILIVNGVNLMPHEIEGVAETTTGGGGSCRAAAFSVASGAEGEVVVVVVEVPSLDESQSAAIEREIRVGVGRILSVPVSDVVFVRRGRIPKTTSGKVQRGVVREQYLAGDLQRLNTPPGR